MGTEPVHGLDGRGKPQGMIKAIVGQIRGGIGQIFGSNASPGLARP
jgi:hypothetical protein